MINLKIKDQWYNAIDIRTSRRTYENKAIEKNKLESIETLIREINSESGLNIQFVKEGEKVFNKFKASYGLIKGVNSFIALVGNSNISNIENKLGYYGEFLVLEATQLGLGTCWIGGTYDKDAASSVVQLKDNEKMYCIIAVGIVKEDKNLKEKLISSFSKNKKPFNEVLSSEEKDIPAWVKSGIEAVIKAPSAINKQPWKYSFEDNNVKVCLEKENDGYGKIDIGISMAHFELGARRENYNGKWKYGNNENIFIKSE